MKIKPKKQGTSKKPDTLPVEEPEELGRELDQKKALRIKMVRYGHSSTDC